MLWDERTTETALDFLRDTRVRRMVTTGPPGEEGEDSEVEVEEGGPDPP